MPCPLCGAVTQDTDIRCVFLHRRPHQTTLHPGRVAGAAAGEGMPESQQRGAVRDSPLLPARSLSGHHRSAVVPPEPWSLIRLAWTHASQNVSDQRLETEAQRRPAKCPRSHSRTDWDPSLSACPMVLCRELSSPPRLRRGAGGSKVRSGPRLEPCLPGTSIL